MTPRPLRAAVLGCGMIAPPHLLAWSRCVGADAVAVCDPDLVRAQARAAEFGLPGAAVFTDVAAMTAAIRPDVVDIVTPRHTHAALIRCFAAQDIPVLCEKPLCPTHEEGVALLAQIGEARVMVNENWRYRAYFRRIAAWLGEGRLGTVTQVRIGLWRSSMLSRKEDGRIHSIARQPFLAHEERVLIAESLIHEIDVVRALFGDVDVLGCATARTCTEIRGEDSAILLLRTRHGVPVTIDGVMTARGHDARAPDRLEIAGTRCSVLLENAVLRLVGDENETITYDEADVRQGCFDASIQHFVDQVRSGGPFWTDARSQLEGLRVMEDAYRLAAGPHVLAAAALPPVPPPRITGIDA